MLCKSKPMGRQPIQPQQTQTPGKINYNKPKNSTQKLEKKKEKQKDMSCTVALVIPNSPAFQSPRLPSIFCKPSPSPSIIHGPQPPASSSLSLPPSSLSSFSPGLSSPKSPLSPRVNKTKLESKTDQLLKRKRPGILDIPVAGVLGFCLETPKKKKEKVEVVEVEGDGYFICSKRGRRGGIQQAKMIWRSKWQNRFRVGYLVHFRSRVFRLLWISGL